MNGGDLFFKLPPALLRFRLMDQQMNRRFRPDRPHLPLPPVYEGRKGRHAKGSRPDATVLWQAGAFAVREGQSIFRATTTNLPFSTLYSQVESVMS